MRRSYSFYILLQLLHLYFVRQRTQPDRFGTPLYPRMVISLQTADFSTFVNTEQKQAQKAKQLANPIPVFLRKEPRTENAGLLQ